MDRQIISKACYDIRQNNRVGEAQSLFASAPRQQLPAPGAFNFVSTVQRSCLTQTLNVDAAPPGGPGQSFGTVNTINLAGQSCLVSNAVCGLRAFASASFGAHSRALGISLSPNMQIVVAGNVTAASDLGLAVGLDPLDDSQVQTRADQAHAYNYAYGLGSIAVPAQVGVVPGAATLNSVSNREVTLGEIVMELGSAGAGTDIYVTSFRIMGLEMLGSATNNQDVPLAAFLAQASTIKDLTLGYCIQPQGAIAIDLINVSGAPITVSGTIFCLPWSGKNMVSTLTPGKAKKQILRRR